MLTYIRAVVTISGSIKLVIFMTANLLAVVLESGTEVATLPYPALMKVFQRMEMLKTGLSYRRPVSDYIELEHPIKVWLF